MPEGQNVEIAHKLAESDSDAEPKAGWELAVEIVEVLLLVFVAMATAWSGYQAAQWDGRQAVQYGDASRLRFQADAASLGGQQLVADSSMFTAWLQANETGNIALQRQLVRRFTPEYRTAFTAWLATNPQTNPTAPVGGQRSWCPVGRCAAESERCLTDVPWSSSWWT